MPETLLTYAELRRYGIPYHRVHLNRKIDRGEFPSAIQLGGNRIAWRLSDIERWLASRPLARPAPKTTEPPPPPAAPAQYAAPPAAAKRRGRRPREIAGSRGADA